MTTKELTARIAEEHGLSSAEARRVVDTIVEAIAAAAERGEEVAIGGFGRFKVKESAARTGRNPATGESIDIPASRKLAFKPAQSVRDRLNA